MSQPLVRAAVAALTAIGVALGLATLPEKAVWAAVEVSDVIILAFEPGCHGSGAYEVVNETKGVVQNRQLVSWSPTQMIYVESRSGGMADAGDRLVVRLFSADGRLLFTAPVPFFDDVIINGSRLPDYLLAVRLDCSRIPYQIAEHLSWSPSAPATSTSTDQSGSPGIPPLLVLPFGLAFVAAWAYFSSRHDHQPAAPRNRSVTPRSSARRGRSDRFLPPISTMHG